MVNPDPKAPHSELAERLQKLMFLRVLFVSFLLGASIFIQIRETKTYFGDIQTAHYVLIATVYFLTFIYVVLFKHSQNLIGLAYGQLLMDTFIVTAMIYTTGGIESIFSFLYILTIINSSIILYRRGGMTIASASSILYGLLLDLHYYDVIHPLGSRLLYPAEYQSIYIFYMILVNIVAFYLVAFLSSYPSEQARKSRVELRAKEVDLVKLEALNEWIIQSITSGLITLDDRKRIILFNPAAEAIFGVNANQAVGKRVTEVLPFLEDHLMVDPPAGERDSNSPEFIDLPFLRQDGERLFLRFSISPLSLPEGMQRGQILFFQDLTKIKQIEEEMKKVEGLALIGELAAGIAHEIRNPMASISGSFQMLKEGLEYDDVKKRLVDIITREISRLNNLVNDFLLFARPKPAIFQRCDLNQLIYESLELFQNSGNWSQNMHIETDFRQPLLIESDPEQLKQVMWNLFLNASEAMEDGGELRIITEMKSSPFSRENKRESARITVRDSGEGFNEKALVHIFTPFFTTKTGGSGLGLAIVKRIVEGLKGSVHGTNHSDGGAEVTITLHPFPSSQS